MAVVSVTIEADFDKSGTYETNLTPYVNSIGGGFVLQRGMNADGSYRAAQVTLGLDNSTGIFTQDNTSSALFGLLEPKVPIRIIATHSAVNYTQFTGYITSYECDGYGVGSRCNIRCEDIAAFLGELLPVNVTVASRTTSAAITAIATAIGLVAGDYNLDTGVQTLPVHYVRNQDALSAIMDVVRSEMGGHFWIQKDGKLRFEARNSRLGTTVDQTWGDTTSILGWVRTQITDEDQIDNVIVQANIFAEGLADQEIMSFSRNSRTGDSLSLAAGEEWIGDVDYEGPAVSITTPVSGTDYTANTLADGTGTDRTANLSVTVTDLGAGALIALKNTHATDTIYVTKFVIRGQAWGFVSDRPRFQYTKPVSGVKLSSGAGFELPFADDTDATRDFAPALVHTFRWPYQKVILRYTWDSDAIKVAMLSVDLGDLIKFADKAPVGGNAQWVSGVNDWFYVESIRHDLRPAGAYESEITLVPSYLFRNLDRTVYDTFNRSNATGDLGSSTSGDVWADDGSMDITSGAARASSDTLQMPNLDLGTAATDQVIEVSLSAVGVGDEVGLVFRHVDANNQYRAYVDKGSNEVILEKNVASVMTEILSPAFTVGTAHEMRVMVQSTRIRVWVDRRLYIDTTDSALSTGTKVGLFARTASGTTLFNDVYGQGL